MSNIQRKLPLALALTAAIAVTTPAMAVTTTSWYAPTPYSYNVADVDIVPANALMIDGAFGVDINPSDQIIGRTTGFSLKITLPPGVKFGGLALGPTYTGGSAVIGTPAAPGWIVALASGTGNGQNVAVFTFAPGPGATAIGAGTLFGAGFFTLTGVTGAVTASIQIFDPVTTADILNPLSLQLVASVNALQYSVHIANPNQRIDVGSANAPSRTLFSPFGGVNAANDTTSFNAGTVQIVTNPSLPGGVPIFNGGSSFINTGPFGWGTDSFSTGDTVDLALVGNFTTFAATGGAIYLSGAACATTVPGGAKTATINAAGSSADFGSLPYASVNNMNICFIAPGGAVTINPTTIVANVTATRAKTGKSDTGSANALAMQYNGPVQTAFSFNPATNTNQESFLRISNTSGQAGQISITAVDDTGHKAGPVTFNLGASSSIQLSSSDLENGNAAKGLTGSLGTGTGKWIVTVVGQVGSMEVTNLNRNNGSGTLNNLGTPVTLHGQEQYTPDVIPQGH